MDPTVMGTLLFFEKNPRPKPGAFESVDTQAVHHFIPRIGKVGKSGFAVRVGALEVVGYPPFDIALVGRDHVDAVHLPAAMLQREHLRAGLTSLKRVVGLEGGSGKVHGGKGLKG